MFVHTWALSQACKTADDHMQLENNLAPFSNFFPEMIYIYQQWFDARAKIRILSRVWFLKRYLSVSFFIYLRVCLLLSGFENQRRIFSEDKASKVRHVDLVMLRLNDICVKSEEQYNHSPQHHH